MKWNNDKLNIGQIYRIVAYKKNGDLSAPVLTQETVNVGLKFVSLLFHSPSDELTAKLFLASKLFLCEIMRTLMVKYKAENLLSYG